jgi:hypothetical protein
MSPPLHNSGTLMVVLTPNGQPPATAVDELLKQARQGRDASKHVVYLPTEHGTHMARAMCQTGLVRLRLLLTCLYGAVSVVCVRGGRSHPGLADRIHAIVRDTTSRLCWTRSEENRLWVAGAQRCLDKMRPLTPEEHALLRQMHTTRALTPPALLGQIANVDLTSTQLRLVLDGRWLDDEAINYYVELLNCRGRNSAHQARLMPECRLRTHCWSTWLWVHLRSSLYTQASDKGAAERRAVRRWSQRAGVSTWGGLDRLFVPMHLHKTHYAVAMVDFRQKEMVLLDSLANEATAVFARDVVFPRLCLYLEQEAPPAMFPDWSEWTFAHPCDEAVPHQYTNQVDCGVFVLMYMERLTENRPLDFSLADMPYLRQRLALELTGAIAL